METTYYIFRLKVCSRKFWVEAKTLVLEAAGLNLLRSTFGGAGEGNTTKGHPGRGPGFWVFGN